MNKTSQQKQKPTVELALARPVAVVTKQNNPRRPKRPRKPRVSAFMSSGMRPPQSLAIFQSMVKNSTMFPDGRVRSVANKHVVVADEYIADINGSVAFATTPYNLNPGQSTTFPRLSKEAVLYEKYRFLAVEFYFKPMVSGFATNGQSGKIMLSFDTDAADAAPSSKQNVEDTDPHADAMPYQDVCLALGPQYLRSGTDAFYVRPAGLPGGTDIKTYDVGVLYASTVACSNTSPIGELRIRYAVELAIPVLETTTAPTTYSTSAYRSTVAEAAGATGVAQTLALAGSIVNGLGTTNVSGVITLPAGNFLINGGVNYSNTGANITSAVTQLIVNGSPAAFAPTESSSATTWQTSSAAWYVTSTGSTTVSLSAAAIYAAGTSTVTGFLIIHSV